MSSTADDAPFDPMVPAVKHSSVKVACSRQVFGKPDPPTRPELVVGELVGTLVVGALVVGEAVVGAAVGVLVGAFVVVPDPPSLLLLLVLSVSSSSFVFFQTLVVGPVTVILTMVNFDVPPQSIVEEK